MRFVHQASPASEAGHEERPGTGRRASRAGSTTRRPEEQDEEREDRDQAVVEARVVRPLEKDGRRGQREDRRPASIARRRGGPARRRARTWRSERSRRAGDGGCAPKEQGGRTGARGGSRRRRPCTPGRGSRTRNSPTSVRRPISPAVPSSNQRTAAVAAARRMRTPAAAAPRSATSAARLALTGLPPAHGMIRRIRSDGLRPVAACGRSLDYVRADLPRVAAPAPGPTQD